MDITRIDQYGNEEVIGFVCDRCHFKAEGQDTRSHFERDEFLRIDYGAGYSSRVYYDGDTLRADLCQYCVRHLLGPFLRLQGKQPETERHAPPSPSLLDMVRADLKADAEYDPRKAPSPLKDTYRGQ
jgi:hypothetical protein